MSYLANVKPVGPCAMLKRDTKTGIAWVHDGTSGCDFSIHPNISVKTGTIRSMKKLGYWKETDRCIRSHGYIYNIDMVFYDYDLPDSAGYKYEHIAAEACMCPACVERKIWKRLILKQ